VIIHQTDHGLRACDAIDLISFDNSLVVWQSWPRKSLRGAFVVVAVADTEKTDDWFEVRAPSNRERLAWRLGAWLAAWDEFRIKVWVFWRRWTRFD
jgi:hypothetical protein